MSYKIEDGTFITELDGKEIEFKLNYRQMSKLDKRLNNINTFLIRSSTGNISFDDVVDILHTGVIDKKMKRDEMAELVFNESLLRAQVTAIEFLVFAMNGGREVEETDEDDDGDEKK